MSSGISQSPFNTKENIPLPLPPAWFLESQQHLRTWVWTRMMSVIPAQHNFTTGNTQPELRDVREGGLFWSKPAFLSPSLPFCLPLLPSPPFPFSSYFFPSLIQTFAEHLLKQRHWTGLQPDQKVSSRRAAIFVCFVQGCIPTAWISTWHRIST